MSNTESAIHNLTEAFCLLDSNVSHEQKRELFEESLTALARIAQAELINQMQLQCVLAGSPLDYKPH